MALIICEQCGKKISDTTKQCIHCGYVLNKIDNECYNEDEEQDIKQEYEREFSILSCDEKILLEKEFLKNDKWARKYRRTNDEASSFAAPIFVCFISAYLFLKIYFEAIGTSVDPIKPKLLNCSLYLSACLGILLAGMLLYSILVRVYLTITHSRFIYMKKFQKWLLENKNINYIPDLTSSKHRKIFDNIQVN